MKVELIETSVFTRRIAELMPDDHYRELQMALLLNPEAGAIIPGTGGLRKVRWALPGQGKRGGVWIVYYWYTQGDHTLYAFCLCEKRTRQSHCTAKGNAQEAGRKMAKRRGLNNE